MCASSWSVDGEAFFIIIVIGACLREDVGSVQDGWLAQQTLS